MSNNILYDLTRNITEDEIAPIDKAKDFQSKFHCENDVPNTPWEQRSNSVS